MKIAEKTLFFCILIPQISLGYTFFESSKAFCKPSGYTARIPESTSTLLSFGLYTQKNNRYLAPIYLKFEELKKALKEITSGEEKNRLLISNDEEFKRLCITIQEKSEKNNLLFERDKKARKLSRFLTQQNKMPTIAIQALIQEETIKRSHVHMLERSSRDDIHYSKKTTFTKPLKTVCDTADIFAQLRRPTDSNYGKKPIATQPCLDTQTDFPTQETSPLTESCDDHCSNQLSPSYRSVFFLFLTRILS